MILVLISEENWTRRDFIALAQSSRCRAGRGRPPRRAHSRPRWTRAMMLPRQRLGPNRGEPWGGSSGVSRLGTAERTGEGNVGD